jgi:L-threonylcarbamoyladenylate synthase
MTIEAPTEKAIDSAAKTLKSGGIVAFPTETVYGLGCDTFNTKAIELIYKTKGRPITNPMITHIQNISWVKQLSDDWDDRCDRLANEFWPGPLTIVLPKKNSVPKSACGGRETIAIRFPKHRVAQQLLKKFGHPVSAPSANISGYISPTTAKHVDEAFGTNIKVIDGGTCEDGIESTVLSLVNDPTILRPGTITRREIEGVIGPVFQPKQSQQTDSPGTTRQHYSPNTPTRLVSTKEIIKIDDKTCAAIVLTSTPKKSKNITQMPLSPKEYGSKLYRVLRESDGLGASIIYIEKPPITPNWFAIQDRLSRCAAAH